MEDWKNPLTPILWIAGSLVLFSLLLLFIIILTKKYVTRIKREERQRANLKILHNEEMLQNSIEIQEKERIRIAADIHDELIGQLRRIQLMNNDDRLTEVLKNSIVTARRISHDLTPPLLEESTLGVLFENVLQPMNTILSVDFHIVDAPHIQIPDTIKINIYRIFQEVITNIEKHANATQIFIRLKVSQKLIFLSIRDNGKGLSGNQKKGLGMKNITLRSKQLNATFKFEQNKPTGTRFALLHQRNE
ncbi:sensor histidine kinase [Aquimarina spongiae]|uniref:histidine kinase n=1 Tax=Aquimarina spongiae TaxID=570521 RepID=A0A1M6KUK2_9FLAO|nr:ATP-binding protein [Aquimarina spongiae]SHJ62645.1 Histidine kinase-, DNA gyrase B-, and HSP90-like ATPase [Aquimarina spongiae]